MEYRIKEICKAKGITLKEIAEKIGSSQASISRIASGSNTTTETLDKIATILNVTVSDLLVTRKPDTISCPHCGGDLRIIKY